MLKKTVIALTLLAVTTLSGCVVYDRPVAYGPAVVVAPVPVWRFWGWGWHGGGRWR